MEAEGWLERRVERGPGGRIFTRTFVYDAPGRTADSAGPPPPGPARQVPDDGLCAEPGTKRTSDGPNPAADPRATAVLASLRHRDARLALSERETTALAPDVAEWLDRGVGPYEIAETLTAGLPARITRRPARLLAYRLATLRPPARTPEAAPPPFVPPVVPLQNCDGCDRAFRAPRPGRCRDCRASAVASGPLAA